MAAVPVPLTRLAGLLPRSLKVKGRYVVPRAYNILGLVNGVPVLKESMTMYALVSMAMVSKICHPNIGLSRRPEQAVGLCPRGERFMDSCNSCFCISEPCWLHCAGCNFDLDNLTLNCVSNGSRAHK